MDELKWCPDIQMKWNCVSVHNFPVLRYRWFIYCSIVFVCIRVVMFLSQIIKKYTYSRISDDIVNSNPATYSLWTSQTAAVLVVASLSLKLSRSYCPLTPAHWWLRLDKIILYLVKVHLHLLDFFCFSLLFKHPLV